MWGRAYWIGQTVLTLCCLGASRRNADELSQMPQAAGLRLATHRHRRRSFRGRGGHPSSRETSHPTSTIVRRSTSDGEVSTTCTPPAPNPLDRLHLLICQPRDRSLIDACWPGEDCTPTLQASVPLSPGNSTAAMATSPSTTGRRVIERVSKRAQVKVSNAPISSLLDLAC